MDRTNRMINPSDGLNSTKSVKTVRYILTEDVIFVFLNNGNFIYLLSYNNHILQNLIDVYDFSLNKTKK